MFIACALMLAGCPASAADAWSRRDVGVAGPSPGKAEVDASTGRAILQGFGADIGGAADSFFFLHQQVGGDARITVKIPETLQAFPAAKVALMFRNGLGANAVHETIAVTRAGVIQMQARKAAGGATTLLREIPGRVGALWLKLARTGGVFSAFVSADGRTWELVATDTAPMAASLSVGLALTSGSGTALSRVAVEALSLQVGDGSDLAAPTAPNLKVAPGFSRIALSWEGAQDDTGIKTYEVLRDGVPVASLPAPASEWIDAGAMEGRTHSYAVVAYDTAGKASAPGAPVSAALLPAPERLERLDFNQDIGAVGLTGSAVYQARTGVFTLQGAGAGLGGAADGFNFSSQTLAGDGEIVARVDSVACSAASARAGIMLREGLAPNARNFALLLQPNGNVLLQCRVSPGGPTTVAATVVSGSGPRWLKLSRSGNTVAAFLSRDGAAWEFVGVRTATLPVNLQAGLATASGSQSALCKAELSAVRIAAGAQTDSSAPGVPVFIKGVSDDSCVRLTWSAATDDRGVQTYNLFRNGVRIQSVPAGTTTFLDRQLAPATPYTYTVSATDAAGKPSPLSAPLTVSTEPSRVAAPWLHADVGTPGVAGGALQLSSSALAVSGAGAGAQGNADAFHFCYQPLNSDAQIVARVVPGGAAAGVMIRRDLTPGSVFAAMQTAGSIAPFSSRTVPGGVAKRSQDQLGASPLWVKLVRRGDTVTGFKSVDGRNWNTVGVQVLPPSHTLLIGLAAASGADGALASYLFDSVQIDLDRDGDGLFDGEEAALGSDPLNRDTDADGLSDFDEVRFTRTNPLSKDVDGFVDAVTVPGAGAIPLTGKWGKVDTSIYCAGLQGSVEFAVEAPEADLYRLQIFGRDHYKRPAPLNFSLQVFIDGEFAGPLELFSANAGEGVASCYTPWLTKGAHTVRVVWINPFVGVNLRIERLVLQRLGGPDRDGDGRKDWVQALLDSRNGIDETTLVSRVSPACLEGFAANPAAVSLQPPVGVRRGVDSRWFANVPLSPDGPVPITVGFDSGSSSAARNLVWARTNVLKTPSVILRKGDSLLLTAVPASGAASGPATLTIQGAPAPLSVPAGAAVPYQFTQRGVFTVKGALAGAAPATGTMTVTVLDDTLPQESAAWQNRTRSLDCPRITKDAVLQSDTGLSFEKNVALPGGGTRYMARLYAPEVRRVVARAGVNGPILDSATVNGFDVINSLTVLDQKFPDNSMIIEHGVVFAGKMSPGFVLRFEVFAAGVMFEDGTVVKELTAADFDPSGKARVRFLKPATSPTSVCHRTKALQNGVLLGNL
jgi:regulation of enolase protein 1 (concanavalin A-like superfamily)